MSVITKTTFQVCSSTGQDMSRPKLLTLPNDLPCNVYTFMSLSAYDSGRHGLNFSHNGRCMHTKLVKLPIGYALSPGGERA
jgi:hypothetical protein